VSFVSIFTEALCKYPSLLQLPDGANDTLCNYCSGSHNLGIVHTRVYPKVSGLAAWSENCKWHSSLPLGAVVSLFCESV
jgi:hypothetical protein